MAIASKNILIEIPDPVDSVVQIDLRDYFGGDSFEITNVSDINPSKAEHIYISTDAKKLSYHPNPNCGLWGYPVLSTDSFSYTIKDLTDESESTGTITLTKTDVSENFKAQDVFIHMNNPVPKQIKVDILEFNQHADAQLVSFGDFDENYIDDIKIAQDNPNELIIDLNLESQWDHNDDKTFVEFTLRDLVSGDSDKAKLYINRSINSFTTPQINIDLEGREPGEFTFDFNDYNIPFRSKFVSAGFSNPNAGTVEIIDANISDYNDDYDASFGPIERALKFNFNMESGFWSNAKASVAIRYTVKKDDNFSSNYLIIHKDNNTAENTYTVDLKMNLATYLTKINRMDSVIFAHLFREENLTIDEAGKVSQSNDIFGNINFEQSDTNNQPSFESPNTLVFTGDKTLTNTQDPYTTNGGCFLVHFKDIGDGDTIRGLRVKDTLVGWFRHSLLELKKGSGQSYANSFFITFRMYDDSGGLGTWNLSRDDLQDVMFPDSPVGLGIENNSELMALVSIGENGVIYFKLYAKLEGENYKWGVFNSLEHGDTNNESVLAWLGKYAPYTNPTHYIFDPAGSASDIKSHGIIAFDTANISAENAETICKLLEEDQQLTPANDFLKTIKGISSVDRIVFASNFMSPDLVIQKDNNEVLRIIDLSSNGFDFVQPMGQSTPIVYDPTNGVVFLETDLTLNSLRANVTGKHTQSARGHILWKGFIDQTSFNHESSNNLFRFSLDQSANQSFDLIIQDSSAGKFRVYLQTKNSFIAPTTYNTTFWYIETEFDYNQDYEIDLYWNLDDEPVLRMNGIEHTNWNVNGGNLSEPPQWLGQINTNTSENLYTLGNKRNNTKLKGLLIVDIETTNLTIAESQSIFNKMIAP